MAGTRMNPLCENVLWWSAVDLENGKIQKCYYTRHWYTVAEYTNGDLKQQNKENEETYCIDVNPIHDKPENHTWDHVCKNFVWGRKKKCCSKFARVHKGMSRILHPIEQDGSSDDGEGLFIR